MADEEIPASLQQRAFAGDPQALRELLLLHLPAVAERLDRRASRRLRRRESTSDLVQSLAGDLLAELGDARFRDLAAFRAWLQRTAQNKLIDKERFHRAQRRDAGRERAALTASSAAEPPDRRASPSLQAIGRERQEILARALAELPEDQRRVVTMARLQGRTHAEIAVELGRSEPACRMLLRRALVRLATLLDRPQ
jgi:RNA polymerase sigma-70 factor (ECF subfamily)